MDQIVEWLRQQLDEDERTARAATPGPWRYDPGKHHHIVGTPLFEEAVFAGPPGSYATCVAGTGETDDRQSMADAEYIAEHDPTRVLGEIHAKREVISKYATAVARMEELATLVERLKAEGRDTFMPDMDRATAIHRRDVLAQVLRLLALPYADRPGYKESWRP